MHLSLTALVRKRPFTTLSISLLLATLFLTSCDTTSSIGSEEGNSGSSELQFITDTAWVVPHDVTTDTASQLQLAQFAWKEFIALNWPSSYKTDEKRGTPDKSKTAMDFLAIGNYPNTPLVWETYMHRVELFPKDSALFRASYDVAPKYKYTGQIQNIENEAIHLGSIDTIFNNLDETSEINLCTVFTTGDTTAPGFVENAPTASFLPGAPRRVIYEAKANKVFYKYIKEKKLYITSTKKALSTYTNRKISNATNKDTLGGLYPCPNDDSLICFPHGVIGGSEGSIEVKASWRQLSAAEFNSGRFLTAPVLYYREGKPSNPSDTTYFQIISGKITASSRPFGHVGLHIIHKTKNVPTYIFATFEQADNINDKLPQNELFLYNRNWNVKVDSGKQPITNRIHAISSHVETLNNTVHQQMTSLDSSSVWQYYKLIGVQGMANGNQDTTDFLLANSVTETNETLANFVGTLDNINGVIKDPKGANVHKGPQFFVQGGCKGCHGNSQKTDFSFITQNAPFYENPNKAKPDTVKPDVVNQPLLIQTPKQNGGPLQRSSKVVPIY